MEKTFLKLNRELSVMILSLVCMFFAFISEYSNITSVISFVLIVIKSAIFMLVPFLFYVLEKRDLQFKKIAAIYTSYFIINFMCSIFVSIVTINIFKSLFDLVNLVIIVSCLAIFIEYALCYSDNENQIYYNTIMRFVYLIGNTVSYPFIKFINKKVVKNNYHLL